jgi:DNA (cytosine-5)-methyltransferase 1
MKHLGDITKINGAEIEIVDVITGGSPCQDLSIAGKRTGLAGARSGLFMEQVRIVKEMRAEDKRNGRTGDMVRPRFLVWENVVGAFSSNKGKDFAAVLEEIARIAQPGFSLSELPEKWKWTKAGAIDGDGWSIAWRTHNAKCWGKTIRDSRTGNVICLGTPQRRRRISVVADFGGESAAQIQFDRESVSGHPAESGASGERLAEAAESGFNPAVARSLTARADGSPCADRGPNNDCAPALTAAAGMSGNNQPVVAIPINDKATRWQGGGESRNHDGSGNGLGIGKEGDPSPTLTAGDRHGVAYISGFDGYNGGLTGDVASTIGINCGMSTGRSGVMELSANENGGMAQNMVARRLTPMECERLQGFPDGWTDIGEWRDSKGKLRKPSDSPRYKALGNSIALPFWDFLAKRISAQYLRPVTMGSLFDGIGGFPLVFERHNGKGTARWASEIEEFPIAVTKLRFGED